MRLTMVGLGALAAALSLAATASPAAAQAPVARGTKVTFDGHSVFIDGKRTFLWGGEFHPFRLPSPDLWRDILQKMKANGYNTVAIYFYWGYHSPKQGVYDFTGIRDMDRVLKMAAEEGLYVITRAGPYVNAELSRGGYPGWMVNNGARARTDDPEYQSAADEWLTEINRIIANNQLSTGKGTVVLHQIENELDVVGPRQANHMRHLYDKARTDGITVPIFHNDKGRNGYWVPKGAGVPETLEGPTDMYAFDGYPGGVCTVQNTVSNSGTAPDWGIHGPGGARGGASASPKTPGFAAEYGGGWFDYWGSNGMYECNALQRGTRYQRVFYGTNIANALTIQSFYMTYGGTSWGWMPAPVVFTSYDYGAAISEPRAIRPKALEMKQLGQFIAGLPELAKMEKAAPLTATAPNVQVYHNRNPDTDTRLIFVRHKPSANNEDDQFTITAALPDGQYTFPQAAPMRLNGFDAKLLIAGYNLERQRLVYSTSEMQTHLRQDGEDIALFYGRTGEPGETVLRFATRPRVSVLEGEVTETWDETTRDLRLNYTHGTLARMRIENGGPVPMLLLIGDESVATTFWRQDTPAGAMLQRGPNLVRRATVSGNTLALTGDTAAPSELEVWAPLAVRKVSWNGARVDIDRTSSNSMVAKTPLEGPGEIVLPDLTQATWKFAEGTPETATDFDDSAWAKAEGARNVATIRPPTGQANLGMDAYGFHSGDVWYRGRFQGGADAQRLTLHYGGGGVGMLQLWMDGKFVGQHELEGGLPRPVTTGIAKFTLPPEAQAPGEHVFAVMVRNNSHNWDLDADDFHKETRGLISAALDSQTSYSFAVPIAWKIQGNLGGEDIRDAVRGPLNNGGQYGEREGWHLPGFPDDKWSQASVPAANPITGTTWYRTEFDLDLPKGHDTTLGLSFGDPTKPRSPGSYRVLMFVNGWHMGQFVAHVGPQRTFAIPQGIIDHNGRNTLALAVTSDGAQGNALEAVRLITMRNVRGGLPITKVAAPAWKRSAR